METFRKDARWRKFSADLLKGGAIVVILLWSILSFAPIVDIIYGEQTLVLLTINILFALSGIGALGPFYLLLKFLLTPAARRRFNARSRNSVLKLGGFAAVWLLLYSLIIQ